ncbi:putative transposase (plasmid) [Phaeobacter inhibens]|nr:putative transposase [Phaeobacter inhibens]
MRFRFIEECGQEFPTNRLCQVLGVSSRGLRAYCSRPASQRQRTDMVVLAHITEQSRFSLGSYGRPRMTEELKEIGLNIGHRRVDRLMRENGIRALKRAIALRQLPTGCIHHTDRGSQYCSHDYRKLLRQHEFQVSLSCM